jgi:UDP-N-acetylglucosamine--N-acetylmuramyl-(pentapeptide) pyrophosphoryl-undecaprenol N-acetylglucosamine transferase
VLDAAATDYMPPSDGGEVRILIFGGSQGARYFADSVPPALIELPEVIRSRIKITQQARDEDLQRVTDAYATHGIAADVAPFFKDLPARMANAHLVIGRAGASTVAELTVVGRPAILVPLPHALDNDQLNNALRLQERGGAWCLEQSALTPEKLADEIEGLVSSPETLARAAAAAKTAGRPDAVTRLADFVQSLADNKRRS